MSIDDTVEARATNEEEKVTSAYYTSVIQLAGRPSFDKMIVKKIVARVAILVPPFPTASGTVTVTELMSRSPAFAPSLQPH